MDYRQTKHQVARGSRPDHETHDTLRLFKKTMMLRATYQIRLMAYRAVQERKRLVIVVPTECEVHASLRELVKQNTKHVKIERA